MFKRTGHYSPKVTRFRRGPWQFLVVALLIIAASSAYADNAEAATAVHVVALGDSYTAGVGAGNLIPNSGSCERSYNAYPALWAKANKPATHASWACSQATTTGVLKNQLKLVAGNTNLIGMTVGGNDVDFVGVMVDCVVHTLDPDDCVQKVQAAENYAAAHLPGRLHTLYQAIKQHAPNARVIVMGYPRFYDLSVSEFDCPGLAPTARAAIDQGANVLDRIIKRAATNAGFVFADVRSAFAGHEICDNKPWMHAVVWSNPGESYHPTANGQAKAYLPVFSAAA